MKKILIEIVLADRNWILEEFARQIVENYKGEQYQIEICDEASGSATITYFLPYSKFKYISNSINIALFTHMEEDFPEAKQKFFDIANQCDYCITMSKKYEILLKEYGIKNVLTIMPGVNHSIFRPKLKLGVIGRTYHTNRKLEGVVSDLIGFEGIDIKYTGQGWLGKSLKLTEKELVEFYNEIDYLLITAKIEGGPMPLLEALSSGCQVIAPSDIGFVNEFPHISYKKGDSKDLLKVVKKLYEDKYKISLAVKDISWQKYSDEHIKLFQELSAKIEKNDIDNENESKKIDKVSISIITHGSESKTKGGPTIRTKLIQEKLYQHKDIEEIYVEFYEKNKINLNVDICHVFNNWPLETAEKLICELKSKDKKVVFSPIFLNLSTLNTYSKKIIHIFKYSKNIESDIKKLLIIEKQKEKKFLVETISKHFEKVRNMCNMSDHLIFLSKYEEQLLSSIGIDTSKGTIVKNGVDIPKVDSIDTSLFRKKFGLGKYILTVGRIESRKNQLILAYALKKIDITLVFVGHDDTSEYSKLVKNSAENNVVFIDRIDNRELLYSAYAGAEVFVLPSWSEGAPLAALEAASMGTPLVVSETSGEDEYFGEFAKYVHPLDIKAIQDSVLYFLNLKNKEKYKKEFSLFIRENFNIDKHAIDTLNVYKKVIKKNTLIKQRKIFFDITSLVHTYANNVNPTGGPALEEKIFNTIIKNKNLDTDFICWNSKYHKFLRISKEEYSLERIKKYAKDISLNEIEERIEIIHEKTIQNINTSEVKKFDEKNLNNFNSSEDYTPTNIHNNKKLFIQVGKNIIKSLPIKMQFYIVDFIKKYIKKDFDLDFPSITHYKQIPFEVSKVEALKDYFYNNNFEIKYIIHNDYLLSADIINIGNAWMSNERYLNAILDLKLNYSTRISCLIYDILPITKPAFFPKGLQKKFENHLNKMISFVDKIYTLSNYTNREVKDYLMMTKKQVLLAPLYIDAFIPNSFSVNVKKSNFLNTQPIERGQYVLFVSSISPRKNHTMLIKVWEKIQQNSNNYDKKLVLVGKHLFGNDELVSKNNVEELKKHNILFLSSVSEEELNWLYVNCMFTVYPSFSEGLGLPILESLAYKKACICSKMESIEHINKKGVVKLEADSFFDWYEVIHNLLTNKYLLDSLVNSIEDEISDEECFQNVLNQLIN